MEVGCIPVAINIDQTLDQIKYKMTMDMVTFTVEYSYTNRVSYCGTYWSPCMAVGVYTLYIDARTGMLRVHGGQWKAGMVLGLSGREYQTISEVLDVLVKHCAGEHQYQKM